MIELKVYSYIRFDYLILTLFFGIIDVNVRLKTINFKSMVGIAGKTLQCVHSYIYLFSLYLEFSTDQEELRLLSTYEPGKISHYGCPIFSICLVV